jgi:isocitrate dehydrogenase
VFEEIGAQYPDIQRERYIIDIGAARLATRPEIFDVIVTPNLYGDIISDIAAEMTGSVGLAGSANIGEHVAMFEAIHGSAPDIAGQDKANPSGLLLGAVMMLVHIGRHAVASKIHNAWLATLEAGIQTADLAHGKQLKTVGTAAFADEVIARLGQTPKQFKPVNYVASEPTSPAAAAAPLYTRAVPAQKALVGVDIFLHARPNNPEELATALQSPASIVAAVKLQMITNRGVKVWPGGFSETFCTDHWRCRFVATGSSGTISHRDIVSLLSALTEAGLDVIKTENLCTFDGERGFALGQGQ